MNDPFASAVENTAPPVAETAPVVTTEKPEGANGAKGLSITYKGNNRDPWIVAYADTVSDALLIAADPQMPELMKLVRKGSEFFVSTGPQGDAPSASSAPATPQGGSQGGGKPNPPGVPSINCNHGPRNYVSKANWAALFCGAPQETPDNEKCEPLWRQKDGSYKAK